MAACTVALSSSPLQHIAASANEGNGVKQSTVQFASCSRIVRSKNLRLVRAQAAGEGSLQPKREGLSLQESEKWGEGVSLGTALLPPDADLAKLESLLFQVGDASEESRQWTTMAMAMACPALMLLLPHEASAMVMSGEVMRLSAAELDPSTAKLAISILGPLLAGFNLLFIVRIVMSWYPQLPVGKFPFSLAYAPTEPVLGPTRRLIPPVGGVDVAPVIWVALMSFLNEILLGQQGLLVLLSQQQP